MTGALVFSLDFEKRWGVRDVPLDRDPYVPHLLGVPDSVRGTLALFRKYDVAATWATVGFLFARTAAERQRFSPAVRPCYADARLDPYGERTGEDEARDPVHYGASLISEILATPRQELGTHTFSHFFCLEPGENMAGAFAADLASARAITEHVAGVTPRSIVFPGNQHNPAFDPVLRAAGIACYRGSPRSWMWKPRRRGEALGVRALRLVDAYVPLGGTHTAAWADVARPSGLYDVPASYFLRTGSPLKLQRVVDALRYAARAGRIIHLWWHPHNFGVDTALHLRDLEAVLVAFRAVRDTLGMQSLSMGEVADIAAAARPSALHAR